MMCPWAGPFRNQVVRELAACEMLSAAETGRDPHDLPT
jgi:hypothetical protein